MDELRRFTASDGAVLAYRRWVPDADRADTPVIFLHGAASNGTRWWHLVETGRLRTTHMLLRPDLRGHGDSIWRGPATMERWSDDLAEMLEREGAERAFVVGHCMGANLALHFAACHPRRCAGLVLVEPMPRPALVGVLVRLRRIEWLLRAIVWIARGLNRLGIHRRRLDPLDLEALDRAVHGADSRDAGMQAMRDRYASPWHDWKTLPTVQYLGNLLETLRPLPLGEVRCPSLAMLSAGRLMADPERTRAALAALPDSECLELDAEHWIPTEQPEEMRRLIDQWIMRADTD